MVQYHMAFSFVLEKQDFLKGLDKTITNLKNVIEANSVAYRLGRSSLITDKLVTSLRFVQSQGGLERIIENILLETCYRSEVGGADSADIAAIFTLYLVRDIMSLAKSGCGIRELHQKIKDDFINFSNNILKIKTEADTEQLNKMVHDVVGNVRLSEMVLQSVNMAGLEGTIYPEHTKTNTYSVELVNGYRFDTSPPKSFYGSDGKWQRQYPKVLVVDGIIEQVSEIHGVLESLSKTKEPCILIARGFGDEVLSTLKLNQARRTLDIIPIMVPYDLDGINMVNDIAIVSGAPLVSALKGELISALRYKDLVTVESVTCQGKFLTIINNKTERTVKAHLETLYEKRDSQSVEDISELLIRRIRALGSYCVRLRVASRTDQERQKELEAVDMGLRVSRSIHEKGVVDLDQIYTEDSPFGRALAHTIEMIKDRDRSAISVLSAIRHGMSMTMMITSIEKAVLIAKE